jgi:hypothetical protein
VISEFDTENTYIYYISQTGTGDGQRVATAMSLVAFRQILTNGANRSIHAYVTEAITFSSQNDLWVIDNGDDVDLTSLDSEQPETMTIDCNASLQVNGLSTLTLYNITIDGSGTEYYSPLVQVYGSLIMDEIATLQNRTNGKGSGGVEVMDGGTLIMNEGSVITNCTGGAGGGVGLNSSTSESPANFDMYGGTISSCAAGNGGALSVYGYANATLSGGTIDSCTADSYGGGVNVNGDYYQATLTLSGVTLQNCEASSGGGVYAYNNSAMSIQDTTVIDTCTATTAGGGIYLESQGYPVELNMSGGTITNCSSENGGGINAFGSVVITMSGGIIDTCTASNGGGGFYLQGGASLTFESYTAPLITGGPGSTPIGWAIWYGSAALNPDPSVYPEEYDAIIQNNDINSIHWDV